MASVINTITINLTEKQFRLISDMIYRHCGINLHEGKKALVKARLAKRLRESNFASFDEYLDYACSPQGQDEFTNLVDSISTNLTSFFREKIHLDYLADQFLPRVLQDKKKKKNRTLRLWSAGCSTGEEPYSIAITLLEKIPDPGEWDIKILASDVSTRVLEKAQLGIYDQERIAPLNGQQRNRFMTVVHTGPLKEYMVRPELKQIIRFRYLNLMDPWPFKGPFDAIFCRNVMIYFDKPTQERLVNRFFQCLASGGLLCIGHSESLTGANHKFKYVMPATYAKP